MGLDTILERVSDCSIRISNGCDEFDPSLRNEETSVLASSTIGVAVSTLVYLYADLRLLSATGYASTPFEQLMVESDVYYGRIPVGDPDPATENCNRSPGKMLLALLQELQREAASFRDSEDLDAQKEILQSKYLRRESKLDRRRRRRQTAAPLLFNAGNNDYLGRKTLVNVLGRKSILSNSGGGQEEDTPANNMLLDCIELILKTSLRKDLQDKSPSLSAETLTKNFKLKYSQILLQSMYKDAMKAGLLAEISHRHQDGDEPEDGALLLLEEAINAPPEAPIFGILAKQFKRNSVADRLLSDQSELVWFHDYFPSHEAVFGILVSHERRAIQVVFRGTVTLENWLANLDMAGARVPNPIKGYYPEKQEYFQLHKGIQMYVLRERKDTHQAWWRTICDLVEHFAHNHDFGRDYQLTVSGHSLGGACATIFGFYASTDPRMTRQGPVVVESFAAPMVGCHVFADAFRHQERMGKLRHARFYNQYDMIPRLPFNIKLWEDRGSPWAHTGIGIELRRPVKDSYSVRGLCDRLYYWCIPRSDADRRLVKVRYAAAKTYWKAMIEALKSSVFLHFDIVHAARNHSMAEHEERLERAMMATSDESNQRLSSKTLEDLYSQHLHLDENQLYFDGDFGQKVALQLCQDSTRSSMGSKCREILDDTN